MNSLEYYTDNADESAQGTEYACSKLSMSHSYFIPYSFLSFICTWLSLPLLDLPPFLPFVSFLSCFLFFIVLLPHFSNVLLFYPLYFFLLTFFLVLIFSFKILSYLFLSILLCSYLSILLCSYLSILLCSYLSILLCSYLSILIYSYPSIYLILFIPFI
ncbi:unnamed protein product [Acanthosepion pharaonis]|uniref:Uncharacterized protein n=1 Tax=Acanthosepion pharaonis TaxID=158019 RepID=A0A812E8C9_ACAPH|nr:unnamed protein product [Sepia pharaonis]